MRRFDAVVSVVLLLLAVTGCNDPALKRRIDEQGKELSTLKAQLESLKTDATLDKLVRDSERTAYLTPGSQGYSPLSTDMGTVTVSLDDVQPYASGTKIKLRFGNATNAALDGVKATLEYGVVNEKGTPDNEHAKTKDIDLLKPLSPGSWTSEEFILEGIQPTKLGFVRVHDLQNKSIRLAGR